MLTKLKQLFRSSQPQTTKRKQRKGKTASRPLADARPGDIDSFIEAVYQADAKGNSPWVLRDESVLQTLRRALEFTVHKGVWLQQQDGEVAHWQGRLLSLRHGEGPPLGMVLACRPDDEAAWQLRFLHQPGVEGQWPWYAPADGHSTQPERRPAANAAAALLPLGHRQPRSRRIYAAIRRCLRGGDLRSPRQVG